MVVEQLKPYALFLLSEQCYDNYFIDFNFLDVPCFKALLSKVLGFGIIAGSILVKLPQVLKIVKSKSGAGINFASVLMDLLAITFQLSYSYMHGYPFSSWGDNTFLALQTLIIGALVLLFDGKQLQSAAFVAAYSALLYALNSGLTPMNVLAALQAVIIPCLLGGKLSQAYTNYKNGSTGQLSAVTVLMLFAGSVARIFTSIQETGDMNIIVTFCVSSVANAIIVAQLLYYWNRPSTASGARAGKKVAQKKQAEKASKPNKQRTKKAD